MFTATKPHVVVTSMLCWLIMSACSRTSTGPEQPASISAPVKVAVMPAKPEAISYRATGTEPFWGLSVTQRELRVTWPEPEPSVATAYTLEERADGRTYKGAAVSATVTFKACSDGMSERSYPHTVTVEIADRVLHGCGWPADYDLGPPP